MKEAFGEIQHPDPEGHAVLPRADASAAPRRVAEYQGAVGTVWSYNAGVDWAPVRDIRFRGNYSRAVRAPNVSETGFPLVPNFAPGFTGSVQLRRDIAATRNRAANCRADLGPLLANLPNVAQSLPIVSGSNPEPEAETSDSWTFGAVIQPRLMPGCRSVGRLLQHHGEGRHRLADRADDRQQLLRLARPQQRVLRRSSSVTDGPGPDPHGEHPGRILSNSLIVAPLNFASAHARGHRRQRRLSHQSAGEFDSTPT